MSPRAVPLSPVARRDALVDVTLRLLREHGRSTTTRQIAEAAGVAEGTIFRVFESKQALVEAAVERAFEPGDLEQRIEAIDPALPLDQRLVLLASIFQQRFRATFSLMHRMGLVRPHRHDDERAVAWRGRLEQLIVGVLGDDAQFTAPPDHVAHVFRLLTFAGSHELIADGRLLTPEQIVGAVLHGLRKDSAC